MSNENGAGERYAENEGYLDIVAEVENLSDAEIRGFEAKILPDKLKIYEAYDEAMRLKLAFLYKQPKDSLRRLVRIQRSRGYLVGLHGILKSLFMLSILTGDRVFDDIKDGH